MHVDWERYDAALERNLAETSNAILKRRALVSLHSADSSHAGPLNFFEITAHALYNDLVAHAARGRTGTQVSAKSLAREAMPRSHLSGVHRHRDLEYRLGHVYCDRHRVERARFARRSPRRYTEMK